jgi:hypothetical protein
LNDVGFENHRPAQASIVSDNIADKMRQNQVAMKKRCETNWMNKKERILNEMLIIIW